MKTILKHLVNFIACSCVSFSALATVSVTEGYVRAMPNTVPNTAAYFTLDNSTDEPVRLVKVISNVAAKAELHNMVETDGIMSMRHADSFAIPARGSFRLSPGGDHVMLLNLNSPLSLDQQVELKLVFDNGETAVVTLPVVKADLNTVAQGQHQHH